jgi:hypothetical protein
MHMFDRNTSGVAVTLARDAGRIRACRGEGARILGVHRMPATVIGALSPRPDRVTVEALKVEPRSARWYK